MITVIVATSMTLLLAAAALCVGSALQPASVPNRVVALDLLLVVVVLGIGVLTFQTASGLFVNLLVVLSLIGFVGTIVVARFVERRGA